MPDVARILPVETLTVESVDGYEVARTYTGEVVALRTSEVGFERSGQLTSVLVQDGDRVAAGQSLARLDTRNLQTQRQQLVAERARAEAQLAELRAGPRQEDIAAARAAVRDLEEQLNLQRVQRSRREFLHNEGAISKEELDQFTYGQSSLQARLDQARSNLQELLNGTRAEQIAAQMALVQQIDASSADLDVTMAKSTLKAPFAAVVERQVDEGTVVSAGQPVLRLIENAAPEVRIGMPTQVVQQLAIGRSQTIDLGEATYAATVEAILPEVDPTTRTQTVVLSLDAAAAPQVTAGQTARANVTERIATEGFWLPTSALTQDIRGLWTSYVLVPPETETADAGIFAVQQQVVEIIHQAGDRVLVRGTLQAGDRLVANGVHRLVPGQQVRPFDTLSQPQIDPFSNLKRQRVAGASH
ncbi:MAG: efflux RND transporter periplasmic adaptor subunit [Spirulinaceae cyanobacterium SM2_1_0]|nr:efflux RND transporter periplasmic adaptor subunit [Spirulinaceae cyanobacterium SM2_1_0]